MLAIGIALFVMRRSRKKEGAKGSRRRRFRQAGALKVDGSRTAPAGNTRLQDFVVACADTAGDAPSSEACASVVSVRSTLRKVH